MKRSVLFGVAFALAALIVVAAIMLGEDVDPGVAIVLSGATPSPLPTGMLAEPLAVPFPGEATAVIPHDFFPLHDAHAAISCAACHTAGVFAGLSDSCVDCHLTDDSHQGANGSDCALCHTPTSWADATFDHAFIGMRDCADCHAPPPEHFAGACRACHGDTTNFLNATFDHAQIGATDCVACHTPPPEHFPGACRSCHVNTDNFRVVDFVHTFPLNHGEANGRCATCHMGNETAVYTCTACHAQDEMIEEHADEAIFNIVDCIACHADGEEPDD